MQNRPLSLTIIGCWMIFGALAGLYSALTIRSNEVAMRMIEQMHVSIAFQQTIAVIGGVVGLACAYGLFKGQPWSRVIYVGWSIVGLAIALFTSPFMSILAISAIVLAVVAYFLFRPTADGYFAAKGLQLQRTDA